MRISAWFVMGLALVSGELAVGFADEVKPLDTIAGWGVVLDPVGDCKFRHEAGELSIHVPGAYHDLWPGKGQVNAPLVLQEVDGDFTIEVAVRELTKAEPNTVLPGMASTASFHAGALVLWQDAKNFVRLDRTDLHSRGRAITGCYLHVFQAGERISEVAPIVPDCVTKLRLTRAGDRVSAFYSQVDGRSWQRIHEQEVALPQKLKAGVSALNNTSRENVVRFADLKLTK